MPRKIYDPARVSHLSESKAISATPYRGASFTLIAMN